MHFPSVLRAFAVGAAIVGVAGCGGAGTRHRAGHIVVSVRSGQPVTLGARANVPMLPTTAGSHSVLRFGCPEKPGTTVAIEACEVQRRLRLDRKFNHTVAALWTLLPPSDKRLLARSQRSWLAYRHRQCDVEFSAFRGGSEAPIAAGSCLLRVTAERINDVAATLRLYVPH